MALCMVGVFVTSVLALWPVFGLLTPVYILILSFGSTLSMIFLPSGKIGEILFWIGLASAAYISHTLPHDPVW
jgi:hypothetical protein